MKGCGRYAAVNGNFCIRSSCVGSRSIAQLASRTSARSLPHEIAGSKSATRSTRTSFRGAGTRSDRRSFSTTAASRWMPLTFFMSPTDPRMLATLDATLLPLEKGGLTANSLVYRYNIKDAGDGLSGEEGTFNICTFWLVEALTRAGRHDRSRLEEARLIFERMLGFANHLGLYAEETGHRGEALGNFPQAFTHLALVSAAFNLDRALGPGR